MSSSKYLAVDRSLADRHKIPLRSFIVRLDDQYFILVWFDKSAHYEQNQLVQFAYRA